MPEVELTNEIRPLVNQGLSKEEVFTRMVAKYPKISYSVVSQVYDKLKTIGG